MRRYSITYLIGQSFKNIFRNGVMTSAAALILMSCLIVMGSFTVLVVNINSNIDNLGAHNLIYCYVDSRMDEESAVKEQNDYAILIAENVVLNTDITSGAALVEVRNEISELDKFTEFAGVDDKLVELESKLGQIEAFMDTNYIEETEYNNEVVYLNATKVEFSILKDRIQTVERMYNELLNMDNVASVIMTTKAVGLQEMKETYSNYPTVFENYKKNTLPDRFTISYEENDKVSTLQYNLEHYDTCMYKVICNSDVAENIENIRSGLVLVFGWLLLILFLVSIFVIVNTIKLSVYSRKDEITVMRYVGATGWFISLPFLFEGLFIGAVSATVAFFIEKYLYVYVVQAISQSGFADLITVIPFESLSMNLLIGFYGIGIITSVLGSFFSVNKYTRV